jgi:hypothetical protein
MASKQQHQQVILKEGIYGAFDGQWKSLRDDQIEAVNDFLERDKGMMYSMGHDPIWGDNYGMTQKNIRYDFRIKLSTNEIWMRFGDLQFHKIIIIKTPPPPENTDYFNK